MAKMTKAQQLNELVGAIKGPLQELVDIQNTLDTDNTVSTSQYMKLEEDREEAVRAVFAALLDTSSASYILEDVEVRGTVNTYRDLARAVADG